MAPRIKAPKSSKSTAKGAIKRYSNTGSGDRSGRRRRAERTKAYTLDGVEYGSAADYLRAKEAKDKRDTQSAIAKGQVTRGKKGGFGVDPSATGWKDKPKKKAHGGPITRGTGKALRGKGKAKYSNQPY